MLTELDRLLELGWRRGIFVADDNFIGHYYILLLKLDPQPSYGCLRVALAPFIALTDKAWFDLLSSRAEGGWLDEVNFWSPKSLIPMRTMQSGEPVFFRLQKPYWAIVGYGFFAHFTALGLLEAWNTFGEKNGDPDLLTFLRRIGDYRCLDLLDSCATRSFGPRTAGSLGAKSDQMCSASESRTGRKRHRGVSKVSGNRTTADTLTLKLRSSLAPTTDFFPAPKPQISKVQPPPLLSWIPASSTPLGLDPPFAQESP